MSKAATFMLLLLLLAACGKSAPPPAEISGAEEALCSTIKDAGPIVSCSVNSRGHSVNIVTGTTDDEKAREACAAFAGKVRQAVSAFTELHELKIYSPYRSDKELATCPLDGSSSAY